MRKVILDQGQSPGDILVFSGAIRDLKLSYPDWEIDVRSPCMAIFENNKHLTPLDANDPTVTYLKVGYDDIHNSGWSGRHFSDGFRIELENLLSVKIPSTSLRPDIHLSDDEKKWSNQVEDTFGYRGKFWIVNAGNKGDFILKQWGGENWQELVNLLRDKIQFVQVGEANASHFHPPLKNVFSLVGKTDLRQMIRLAYHAQGITCHVTFHMHLAAAFQKPCVVIAGGREPRRWEMYPNHRHMDTNGLLKCCAYDGCWMSGRMENKGDKVENKTCKDLVGSWAIQSDGANAIVQRPRCMAMIKPERVAEEILNYYNGGVL